MNYITTISSKGQITLPAQIRRALKIRPGDRLNVVEKGNYIAISADSYDDELVKLRQIAKQHLKAKGLENLSVSEIKKSANQAKDKAMKDKYNVRP